MRTRKRERERERERKRKGDREREGGRERRSCMGEPKGGIKLLKSKTREKAGECTLPRSIEIDKVVFIKKKKSNMSDFPFKF